MGDISIEEESIFGGVAPEEVGPQAKVGKPLCVG